MGYEIYKVGKRWAGYGVPAVCEHPDCNEEIDRGMAYACGEEPFTDIGCDRYFCHEHLQYVWIDDTQEELGCKHGQEDCDCYERLMCEKCADPKSEDFFPYKPEHPIWINHLLANPSWQEWRIDNPHEVKKLKELLDANNARTLPTRSKET